MIRKSLLVLALGAGCGKIDPEDRLTPIVISEIMYHPVDENAAEDAHEFVEIFNRSGNSVSLSRWKLVATTKNGDNLSFTFPESVSLDSGAYLVIAKNPTELQSQYDLTGVQSLGPYTGQLDNGGASLVLEDHQGAVVDAVNYDDKSPWPIGADGFGASEGFFEADSLDTLGRFPFAAHSKKGFSLERVNVDAASAAVENWDTSALDRATPGHANGARGTPKAVVIAFSAVKTGGDEKIQPGDMVTLRARFSPTRPVSDVAVEYFVDDLAVTDEKRELVPMTLAGDAYETRFVPTGQGIVRYRILARRGDDGREVISPRASDPNHFHAFFVGKEIAATNNPAYQLFVTAAAWNTLWDNSAKGRVLAPMPAGTPACMVNALLDDRVPAVFVHEGRVYDVLARYQGSRFNRLSGVAFNASRTFEAQPKATKPRAMQALSWSLAFPNYDRFKGGIKTLLLNKLTNACPGLSTRATARLFKEAGIPVFEPRGWVRLFINGGYYHYMLELEHVDEDMLKRVFPGEPIGDLFKSSGCTCDEGPFGWGDLRVLEPFCGVDVQKRYASTYERVTPSWKQDSAEIADLILKLDQARKGLPKTDDLKAFFLKYFDVDSMLTYRAVMNWLGPGDDFMQNFFVYRHLVNGEPKWLLMPYDFDFLFGGWFEQTRPDPLDPKKSIGTGAARNDVSFYIGEKGNPDARNGFWNYLTDAFLKTFRPEFDRRLLELAGVVAPRDPKPGFKAVLAPENVKRIVDESSVGYDQVEADKAPTGPVACPGFFKYPYVPKERMDDVTGLEFIQGTHNRYKKWADDRHAHLMKTTRLSP